MEVTLLTLSFVRRMGVRMVTHAVLMMCRMESAAQVRKLLGSRTRKTLGSLKLHEVFPCMKSTHFHIIIVLSARW